MRTLIINGSPKAKKGNTEVFVTQFAKGMKTEYEICYAATEECTQITKRILECDAIIFAMPLYIHAMPSIVMKIFECMEPAADNTKSMGFIVQSGFVEAAQSKYLERYLSAFTKRMNYSYLGTLIKGGCAAVSLMPEQMVKELFEKLSTLGDNFSASRTFNLRIVNELAQPYELTKKQSTKRQFFSKLGLDSSLYFNMMLKSNKAYKKRFDRPFA